MTLPDNGISRTFHFVMQQQQKTTAVVEKNVQKDAWVRNFEDYLEAQKKRNIHQIMYYTKRFASVLANGDATPLVGLSGPVRRHALEALANYAKFTGRYQEFNAIRQRFSLRWTNGDESLQSLQRFFDDSLTFDVMLSKVKEMIRVLPEHMGAIIKFACLIGLRPLEVCECVRLLNIGDIGKNSEIGKIASEPPFTTNSDFGKSSKTQLYYNPDRQALEHFRFSQIFLRQTKKAYIFFVTPEMLDIVRYSERSIPSKNAIALACRRNGIKMEMHLTRKVFASWLRKEGIQPEVVDMLQGRVAQSVLTRHYLVPQEGLAGQVLKALEGLKRAIVVVE